MHGRCVENNQFVRRQGEHGVRLAFVVREFHLEYARRQDFHDRANLTADQTIAGAVSYQGNDIEKLNRPVHNGTF
jgi:hypothetical protein